MPIRFLCLFCIFLISWSADVVPVSAQENQRPFSAVTAEWDRVLDRALQEASDTNIPRDRLRQLGANLQTIRAEAERQRADAEARLEPLRARLAALGPPPEEADAPEAEPLAAQRQQIIDDISAQDARAKQVELALTRVAEVQRLLTARDRERMLANVLALSPFPLAPSTIGTAVPEFLRVLAIIGESPRSWWQTLTEEQRSNFLIYRLTLSISIAFALGWIARRLLLRWFGRDPELETPSYTRRLTGAIGEGLANGLVPAVILLPFLVRASGENAMLTGLFQEVVVIFCAVTIFLILARALPNAVLAPDLPNWRLLPVRPENARYISRCITALATIFAIDTFFIELNPSLDRLADHRASDELQSLYLFVTNSLEAIGVLALCRATIWQTNRISEEGEVAKAPPEERRKPLRFWWTIRYLAAAIAVATLISSFLGYAILGAELIKNLLASGAVAGGLVLLRGLGREFIGMALRSEFVRRQLDLAHQTRRIMKFWIRAVYDLCLVLVGFVLISPLWGVPFDQVASGTLSAFRGIEIGNVTISVADALAALVVFMVVLLITRVGQRLLSEQVLPNTRMDSGVQNSLTAGLGYVGITIAAMLGITTLGLDLSNIAIIAGALSVGIGFGLQNIVNNFVSGLILLIERPIKVGDWIVIGEHEGFVKRIQVRATEIETFQRASIIIPNSELISGAVTNWTHKDHYGRVEVPVGVAYGSDVDKVMEIMMECLRAHERIISWPEPQVIFADFGDSSLNFEARGFIAQVEWRIIVASEIRIAINRAFAEAGIEIPFPQRDINLRDLDRIEGMLSAHRGTAQGGSD